MRGISFASTAVAAVALLSSTVAADVDPIVIKGSKFFYKTNGTQFFMQGVAYQQDYSTNSSLSTDAPTNYVDPLADGAKCRRDIPLLKELKTNTIRVYAIDPTANHDDCLSQLQAAGIYIVADLSQPGVSINRDTPAWNDALYQRYTAVIDALAPHSNVLGFFAGNEVSNMKNNTAASAFVKAAVRDSKSYIKMKNYRPIGVGYATNDDADIRGNLANYFNCGDQASAIDFWGYNIYSWCGASSFTDSGYSDRTKEFSSYSVPVFFAEYGCNTVQPRTFSDVPTLFSSNMTGVWSGGIVYMYFQEANDFGLVTIGSDNSATKLSDFTSYSSLIAKATPTGVMMNDYNPTNTVPAQCPPTNADWGAVNSPLPPTPNEELCQCMVSSLSCVVKSNTDEEDYGRLFGNVCGLSNAACAGIQANATSGKFGAYGMCKPAEQLSFAFNQYYVGQKNNPSACDFGGAASTQAATKASGNCAALMSQAGSAGTGTVTSQPTGTGSGSGSRPSGTAAKSSTGAATAVTIPGFDMTFLMVGSYAAFAALTGAGMLLL